MRSQKNCIVNVEETSKKSSSFINLIAILSLPYKYGVNQSFGNENIDVNRCRHGSNDLTLPKWKNTHPYFVQQKPKACWKPSEQLPFPNFCLIHYTFGTIGFWKNLFRFIQLPIWFKIFNCVIPKLRVILIIKQKIKREIYFCLTGGNLPALAINLRQDFFVRVRADFIKLRGVSFYPVPNNLAKVTIHCRWIQW